MLFLSDNQILKLTWFIFFLILATDMYAWIDVNIIFRFFCCPAISWGLESNRLLLMFYIKIWLLWWHNNLVRRLSVKFLFRESWDWLPRSACHLLLSSFSYRFISSLTPLLKTLILVLILLLFVVYLTAEAKRKQRKKTPRNYENAVVQFLFSLSLVLFELFINFATNCTREIITEKVGEMFETK
jgi:hypothetical protein